MLITDEYTHKRIFCRIVYANLNVIAINNNIFDL